MGQRTEHITEETPVMFCMAIDNCPINAATVPIFWSVLDISNELSDEKKATVFIYIAFCSRYWQLPIYINNQRLQAFITPQDVVQQTRTTQGAII